MTDFAIDRPMPQAREAERAVLGSILIEPRAMARVSDIVTPAMFSDQHRTVLEVMRELARKLGVIEILTLKQTLVDRGEMGAAGGSAYISSLIDGADPANVERHATIVREKAEARGLLLACNAAMRAVSEGSSALDVASSLRHVLGSIGNSQERRSRGIGDVAEQVRLRADDRVKAGRGSGILTGLSEMDAMTGGYRRKQLSLIAARSSHGKTALMVNTAMGAMEANPEARIAVYSLEMPDEAIVNVIRAKLTRIPLPRINDWSRIPEYDRDLVIQADEYLMRWNGRFYFNDQLRDIDEVCADARRLKDEHGLDAVFVDYLQLLDGFRQEKVRERVVNQLGKAVFDLAKQIDVAGIALSQVNRQGHDRLSIDDLRESKALGHDSWLVLMMNRPWQSHKDRTLNLECETTVQVEKNRGGQCGDLRFHFDGATQTFTEGDCPHNCRYARRAS